MQRNLLRTLRVKVFFLLFCFKVVGVNYYFLISLLKFVEIFALLSPFLLEF